jgi:DNA-binding transcriptional MerR regulator
MRISELSRVSGESIPTIKYYLREGLLPPGRSTARNQAEYSEEHVRRLRLIKVLADIGGLRLRDIRAVLEAIEDDSLPLHVLLGLAHHALGPPEGEEDHAPEVLEARADVDRFLAERGWHVSEAAPARRALARALATLRLMGRAGDPGILEQYARAADRLARREVATVDRARAQAVEQAVIGTVVFESALVALRRLAQEHHSSLRFLAEAGSVPVDVPAEPKRALRRRR